MPAMPSSLLEPVWVEFDALIGPRPEFDPNHPLGCHRRRIPDRVVFAHVVQALVSGDGYERVAGPACSDRTIRRRLQLWAAAGLAHQVHALALAAYHRMIGLDLADIAVDGCITKAPCGGDKAGPSPLDRRKGGLKRSLATNALGIPLGLVSAPANRHDSPLLAGTLHATNTQIAHTGTCHWPDHITVHLDAAYYSNVTHQLLDQLHLHPNINPYGHTIPLQHTKRWPCERTHSWMNGYGKLRRCTDKNAAIIDFYLYLAAAFVTVRALIRQARNRYRWPTRPTTRRLK